LRSKIADTVNASNPNQQMRTH